MQTSLESNKEEFKTQITRLQKALKGSYTVEQVDLLFNSVKRYKVSHLIKTVDHLIMMKTFLCPINDIISGCRVEAYGDEQKEDKEEKQFAREFFGGQHEPKGQMAKEAMKLILSVLTVDHEGFFLKPKKEMSKIQLYQKMIEMDKLYPGIGWEREANKMMEGI